MDQNNEKTSRIARYYEPIKPFVEVIALLVVVLYTCAAYQQNGLTRSSLEVQTRPYIQVIPLPQDPAFGPTANEPLQMKIELLNTGKLPARTHNRSVVSYRREQVKNPGLSDKSATRWVWGDSNAIILPTPRSPGNLSAGDITDMRAGIGWVYVSVVSVYGNNSQYKTRICWEYPLRKDAPLVVGEPKLCSDPTATCTDEDCK